MASSRRFTSDFPSGQERYLSLQQVSNRILNRAGILNSMEERELDRRTRQLEYSEGLKQAQYETIKKRLRGNLRDHELYRRALHDSDKLSSRSEEDLTRPASQAPRKSRTAAAGIEDAAARPLGRYSGRTQSRLTEAIRELDRKIQQRDKDRTRKLLEISRKQSDIVIDRTLGTDQILAANHLPLSERLTITNTEKFQSIIHKSRAIRVLHKLRNRIVERKEQEKGMKLKKTSRGIFHTQNTKTDLFPDPDPLLE